MKLFQPFKYGPLSIANRIVMAPMTRQSSPGNVPNDLVVEYYRRRAANGVGLIITEGTCIGHKAANGYENVPFFDGDKALAAWEKVVQAVHNEGGKIMPQLWHVGGVRKPGMEPDPEIPGYSPSGMAAPGKITGHAMSKDDINDVIDAFARAAKSAEEIGFDGVEIHGAHGYLIDQFFWSGTNQRDDEYGGDLANRSRFAIDIIKAVRAAVAKNFPISFRWSQWKQQEYTARLVDSPEQLATFLQPLVSAGVDIFHCSTRRFWEPEFEGSHLNLAGWTKKLTGKPVITVGSVGLNHDFLPTESGAGMSNAEPAGIDNLLDRMEADEFDLVAVGRALIANDNWPQLVQQGLLEKAKPFDNKMLNTLV